MDTKFLSYTGLDHYDDLIKTYIDTGLSGKSASTHTHDDRYYTESEIDTKLSDINTSVDKITSGDTVVSKATSATSATYASTANYATKAETADSATNASTATYSTNAEVASKLGISTVGSGTQPIYLNAGIATTCTKYAGGTKVTLNGSDKGGTDATIYAPTSGGTAGYILKSAGTASAPVWEALETVDAYTKAEVDTKLSGKSDTDHNHDSKYDAKGASTASLSQSKAYTDEKIALLLNNSSEAVDSIYELRDAMAENTDAIDALNSIASGKADKTHEHAISDITNLQSTLNAKAAKSDFDTHVASTVSHITAAERTTWNAKASTANATTAASGLMSSADKTKLDGIAEGANKYTHPTTSGNKHIPSGGASGQFLKWSADGTAVWAADNDTKYAAGTGIALSGTTFSNSGVRSVVTGTTNGTIIVNTNGTTAAVPVKGLGASAYKNSTTAVTSGSSDLVTSGAVYTVIDSATKAITANTNSISTLTSAINNIQEITIAEINALFA